MGARALVVASFLVTASCGPAHAPAAGACARGDAVQLAPGDARVEPSAEARALERVDVHTGTVVRLGLPLDAHLALAWQAPASELDLALALPPGRFDVCARPADGERATAEAMIRAALAESLGVTVERGLRRGPVLALRLRPGALAPRPAVHGSPPGAAEAVRHPGRFEVNGAPISELVAFLAAASPLPVVDETGLEGRYDLRIEWDPASGPRGLRVALADAGFELVRTRGEARRWLARA